MKNTIDLKSLLIGLLAGIATMLVMAAGDPPATSDINIGKYQSSCGAGFAIVVDTTNGKVWGLNLSANNFTGGTPGFWEKK